MYRQAVCWQCRNVFTQLDGSMDNLCSICFNAERMERANDRSSTNTNTHYYSNDDMGVVGWVFCVFGVYLVGALLSVPILFVTTWLPEPVYTGIFHGLLLWPWVIIAFILDIITFDFSFTKTRNTANFFS